MHPPKFLFLALILGAVAFATWPHSSSIYDEKADAHHDIAKAMVDAQKTNKNVVLVFGANWCPDCHALDAQMHKADLASIIDSSFVVVKVDLGRHDKNLDVAAQYHVPVELGIPALAVLDPSGKLLYTTDQGQFADARTMSYNSIKAFFVKWKPSR